MRKVKRRQKVKRQRNRKVTQNQLNQGSPTVFLESRAHRADLGTWTSKKSRRLRSRSGSSVVPSPPTPHSPRDRRLERGKLWQRKSSGIIDPASHVLNSIIRISRERSAKNLGRGIATPSSKATKTTKAIKTAVPKRSILKAPGREPSKMRKTLIFASPTKDGKKGKPQQKGGGKVNYG